MPFPTLGVLVPCRNESRVVGRKLANLARATWPSADRPHRVVVVDDGSDDGTAEVARNRLAQLDFPEGVVVEVVENGVRPGKSGAITHGLRHLGRHVDVAVLTDADVVIAEGSLEQLGRALGAREDLGMVCAAQRFVADLADDGTCRAADGSEPRAAGGLYDRWTAGIRALESRAGRLFSVHGQLLAWRTELGIEPTPGMAADDLDLMLQVRAAGCGVALVPQARFFEVKTPAGEERRQQELRRARAYVQFLAHPRIGDLSGRGPWAARFQSMAYRTLPVAAPWLLLAALVLVHLVAALAGGPLAVLGMVALTGAFALSSVGRRLARLMAVIASAGKLEARATLSDRWETPRL